MVVIDFDQVGKDGLKVAYSWKHDSTVQKSLLFLSVSRHIELSSSELASSGIVGSLVQPYTMSRLRNRLREALTKISQENQDLFDELDFHLQQDQKKVLNILLVEDNLINQKVAMVILEKIGHAANLAVNGKVAVEMFKDNAYDLVLMDIQMPEMDGLEATRQIRIFESENPDRNPAHICAITANRSTEDEENCYRAGMTSYISKPFRLEELNRVLNHL